MTTLFTTISSPIGELTIVSDGEALTGLYMAEHSGRPPLPAGGVRDDAALAEPARQLRQFFRGERTEFELPIRPAGTPFQRAVWAALLAVPYGETASYGELAQHVGRPGAARAVGLANAHNPLAIVVPCHRVVGASGSLTGYAGGLHRKRWLLAHEARHAA